MSPIFLITGSHPWLSLAEAKAVLGGRAPKIAEQMAIFDDLVQPQEPARLQNRLAGVTKTGTIIEALPVKELTAARLAEHLQARPRGDKILFGLTIYGSSSAKQRLRKFPIELKRALQEHGNSVRWVTGDEGQISPAAIQKMELTTKGYDLCIGIVDNIAYIGLTESVQDIDAWSLRDFGRPARDARNGMLPPKLAHMMVNLALGPLSNKPRVLLDPFCGGSTVLMEAALIDQNLGLIGSDIEAKQIHDSQVNVDWMVKQNLISEEQANHIQLLIAPAQTLADRIPPASIDAIVTEGFLGRPLRGQESQDQLEAQKETIDQLWHDTLVACAPLQPVDGMLVACTPVFSTSHATVAVSMPANLAQLGYQQLDPLSGWKDKPMTLTYARADQFVKRNIVVLKRIK